MICDRTSTDAHVKIVLGYIYTHNDFHVHFSSPNLAKFGLELTAQAVVRAGAEKMLRCSAHPRACKPSRPVVQQHRIASLMRLAQHTRMSRSFSCLRSRSATVRARHSMPSGLRSQDVRLLRSGAQRLLYLFLEYFLLINNLPRK